MAKKRLLLVDDNADVREVMTARLAISGFEMAAAADGEMALAAVRAGRPDLIILDLMLPKINGYEVCRLLKTDAAYKTIPIIILSALSEKEERERAMASGADAYFVKPFDLESLIARIDQLTG